MNAAVEASTVLVSEKAKVGRWLRGMAVAATTAVRLAYPIIIALVACSAACATVPAGRPPSAAEIQTINDQAARGRGLVVEPPLVVEGQPLDPACTGPACPQGDHVVPLERCSAGFCRDRPRGARVVPRKIIDANLAAITFETSGGAPLAVPLDLVRGVTVKAVDRSGGAVVGALLGVGVDLVVAGAIALVSQVQFPDRSEAPAAPCTERCVATLAIGALIPIVVGGIVGSRIGLPRRYVFTNAPLREHRDSSNDDGP